MPTIPFHNPGVTYNGLHSTENPTPEGVTKDLVTTKQHFGSVRTYYPQYGGGVVDVGKIANDINLNLLLGLFLFPDHNDWTEGNYQQFVKPAVARRNIEGILVGNEDPGMIKIIQEYLKKVRVDFPQIPVGTSQDTTFWLTDARADQVVDLVDFIGTNTYPAWDWTRADGNNQPYAANGFHLSPEDGFDSFTRTYDRIQLKYPKKQIVVTETGWPTTYGPISALQYEVGISNAKHYLDLVINWAKAKQVVLYIQNMFDDQFGLDHGSQFTPHFGLIDNAGKSKGVLF